MFDGRSWSLDDVDQDLRPLLLARAKDAVAEARILLVTPRAELFLARSLAALAPRALGGVRTRSARRLDPPATKGARHDRRATEPGRRVRDPRARDRGGRAARTPLPARRRGDRLVPPGRPDRATRGALPPKSEGALRVRWPSEAAQRCFVALDELSDRPAPAELVGAPVYAGPLIQRPPPATEEEGLTRLRER